MNEIAKNNIKEKLETAIKMEGLLAKEAANIFGMTSSHISWIKKPQYWSNVGEYYWERVLLWVNSGLKLRAFAEKHKEPWLEHKNTAGQQSLSKQIMDAELGVSDIKSDPKIVEEVKQLQKKQSQILSDGEVVNFLLQKKQELQSTIDAINVVLKLYS